MTTAHLSDPCHTDDDHVAAPLARSAAGVACGYSADVAPVTFPGGRLSLFLASLTLSFCPCLAEAAGPSGSAESFTVGYAIFSVVAIVALLWLLTMLGRRPCAPLDHQHEEYARIADIAAIRSGCAQHRLDSNRERSEMLETLQRHLDHMRGEIRSDLAGIRTDAEARTVRLHARIDDLEKPTMQLIGQIKEHIRQGDLP